MERNVLNNLQHTHTHTLMSEREGLQLVPGTDHVVRVVRVVHVPRQMLSSGCSRRKFRLSRAQTLSAVCFHLQLAAGQRSNASSLTSTTRLYILWYISASQTLYTFLYIHNLGFTLLLYVPQTHIQTHTLLYTHCCVCAPPAGRNYCTLQLLHPSVYLKSHVMCK